MSALGQKRTLTKAERLAEQGLSVVPQFSDDISCAVWFCHSGGLASPGPNALNLVCFYRSFAHGPREAPLYWIRSWSRSSGIRCGTDISGCDAAAGTTRKPSRDHCFFRKRPTNGICPSAGDFGLGAPQQRCTNLRGRSAQQKSRSEPAPITNPSRRDDKDLYGIHSGGQ